MQGFTTLIQLNTVSASFSNVSISSSFATTATTASFSTSGSYALSASHANNADVSISSSFATTASFSKSGSYALSASHADVSISSSFATTASFSISGSYALSSSNAFSSSYALTSSAATTASFSTTGSYAVTSSFSTSGSYSVTASFASSTADFFDPDVTTDARWDFIGGQETETGSGLLMVTGSTFDGWHFRGGPIFSASSEQNHPGTFLFRATGSTGLTSSLFPNSASSPTIIFSDFYSCTGIIQTSQSVANKDFQVRFGLFDTASTTSSLSTHGVYFEKQASDTFWFAVNATSGSVVRINTSQSYSASTWYNLRIESTGSGTVFYVKVTGSNAVPTSVTASVPSTITPLVFGLQIALTGSSTNSGSSRDLKVDYFRFTSNALAR